jgi:hypothetical protein
MLPEGPLTAAQIYEQVTGGEGTRSLSDSQRSAYDLTKRHHERMQRITSLSRKTLGGWHGAAGSAAADATTPLVEASYDDAAHLARAQGAMTAQMDGFGTAKNSVKPVPPEQPAPTAEDVKGLFEGKGGYWDKLNGYQADSQHNIDTFASYHSASTTNGDELPAQYAQLTDPGATIAMDDGGASKPPAKGFGDDPGGSGRDPGIGERGISGPGPGGPGTGGPGAAGPQPGQSGPQPGTGFPQPNDDTRANSYTPKPVNPVMAPAANLDFGPTGKPINTVNTPGTYPPGMGPFGPGTGGGQGPNSGPGGRMPGGPGGYRGGVPGGAAQPGMGMGRGTGAGMPGEAMGGRGTAGTAGAAGRGGASGMPMAPGAAKGKGEEDKEKKAPAYLQNPDPDETFGGYDEKPMPPVIGEKKPNK